MSFGVRSKAQFNLRNLRMVCPQICNTELVVFNKVGNPKNLICPLLVNLSFWATRFERVASKALPDLQRAKS
jgi:hypothetical protein